ncbi:MAG: flavodoxin FldA [Bacteroidota bacterium]|nr:flavodoxin FldA [Bacteroidota bacterium]
MKRTCVVFGSTTGTCEELASRIASKLGVSDIINAADFNADTLNNYDNFILGTSTWGAGDLQDDWYSGALDVLKNGNLGGKTFAIFGCGDCDGYGDTFCSGMGEIYQTLDDKGANVIGQVSTDGYTFDSSAAVVDGQFVGLALDESNESDKTDERIDAWVEKIKPEL